jgi:hypothetical protein
MSTIASLHDVSMRIATAEQSLEGTSSPDDMRSIARTLWHVAKSVDHGVWHDSYRARYLAHYARVLASTALLRADAFERLDS